MHLTQSPAADADAGLERIKRLEERFALEAGDITARREIAKAVRREAGLYRKTLDSQQAAATLSKKSERSIIGDASPGPSWK